MDKVALFIDIDHVFHQLKSIYNREFDPAVLVEKIRAYGLLNRAYAYGDFTDYPPALRQGLSRFGIKVIQVDREIQRLAHLDEPLLRESKDLELLADVFETLIEAPDINTLLLAVGDRHCVRAISIARNKFAKEVIICGVAGAIAEELELVASAVDAIEVEPLLPRDSARLDELIVLVTGLELRKRYLNFKFIREHVMNHERLAVDSPEAADALLSEAIECGLIIKQKIEDKYNKGQFFTAYALNHHNALFLRRRSSAKEEAVEFDEGADDHGSSRSVPDQVYQDDVGSTPHYGGRPRDGWPTEY